MLSVAYNKLDDEISLEGSENGSVAPSEASESLRRRPMRTLANSAATAQRMMTKRGVQSCSQEDPRPRSSSRPGTAQSRQRPPMTWSHLNLPNLDSSCPASLLRELFPEEGGKLGSPKWRPQISRRCDLFLQEVMDSSSEEDKFAATEPPGSSAFWFQEQMFASAFPPSQHLGLSARSGGPSTASTRLPPLPLSPAGEEEASAEDRGVCCSGKSTTRAASESVLQRIPPEKTAAGSAIRAVRTRKHRLLSVPRQSMEAFRRVFTAPAEVPK